MATVIPFNNPATSDGQAAQYIVYNMAQLHFDVKHTLDHLIAVKGGLAGSNWAAIEAAFGVTAGQGQTFFNAWDTFYANVLNAYNAAADLDQMRPV